MEAAVPGRCSDAEDGSALLTLLPPLPPKQPAYYGQSVMGVIYVLIIMAGCLACVHYGTDLLLVAAVPVWIAWMLRGLTYLQAALALTAHVWVLLADPGYIPRSREACLPLPTAVREALQRGGKGMPRQNIHEAGRTYCVRCFLWRGDDASFHHCSTCQRCVRLFDHHCGVLGRCIAGRERKGNVMWFKLLGFLGGASAPYALVVMVIGMLHSSGLLFWIGFILACYIPCHSLMAVGNFLLVYWRLQRRKRERERRAQERQTDERSGAETTQVGVPDTTADTPQHGVAGLHAAELH